MEKFDKFVTSLLTLRDLAFPLRMGVLAKQMLGRIIHMAEILGSRRENIIHSPNESEVSGAHRRCSRLGIGR
jgi:hypothetical protein